MNNRKVAQASWEIIHPAGRHDRAGCHGTATEETVSCLSAGE
jgi:hypothetical protein